MENMVREDNFWKNKKVLITGISGFVGSHLAKELINKKANVIGLIRDYNPYSYLFFEEINNKIIEVRGSVTDLFLVQRVINEYEVDTVFHLAAQTIVGIANNSPLSTFESNIMGTWNVLEACRTSKTVQRVIIASSDKAYGEQENLPYKETHPLNGLFPYDASKACADILARSYYKTYKLPVAVTRASNIYGEGDLNFSRIVPGTIRSIIYDEEPIIRSDGKPIRDYIYVEDIIQGYLVLAEKLHEKNIMGEAFNFGTNKPISVLDLVKLIIEISGKKNLKPKILNIAKGEIYCQYLDSRKARERLGWENKYSLENGLNKTYKWYEEYFEKFQK
ncbi:GDP-mannose 4,6-dehydratase [Candidatus Aminicenantes bacterium AC-708-M15]|jgi:CDP-glucose 4,6-dehydratase|nr:GDP-mannose 4,6-dehydratase [SCandidatus Aminicenantes bacterium Aminicenantia_JdfR_composite]MCP2597099.1 GDP-mannose 4,6-dehydratase [Candidatus Aminicenantes bacterium AC-335-G13]MCP2598733.1 GDP-mannose 4,6-dehydratase [Candidatus Aminicenantes bacterium AC-335-L06]MCP2604510.1 GDP-mannose 4,6-dehydratase [Candidatus Aminicenantes bacterium AC-708-M15]MCP2605692.1 GDP-mannose 4,6-dehydratase [Candidatus Aminicenantes bacterium AC-335-O07]MCP2606331.1 GDP-mannose 4,6-dehydratase [Candida